MDHREQKTFLESMDILILNWKDVKNPQAGGAEIIAFEFARRLVKEGNTVTFFSRLFNNANPEEVIDGVRIIRRGNKYTLYLYSYLYYKSLKHKPDKVLEMVNTLCWQTPLYVSKSKRVAYLNQLAKEVWFYEEPFPISLIGYFLEKLQYFSYKTTRFLCYSESTKQDLISYGIKSENISVFPLGLDQKRYFPGTDKSPFPHFIFVARLVKMKRAELCIRSLNLVMRGYPDVKLTIVGNGPDEERLVELVKKYDLEKNVDFVTKNNFFLDKTKGDKKVDLMQKAWVLLLPSVKEGWGMVVTEAAACGTPAIVTQVTGLVDSVRHKETGIIISKNPSEIELANAMIELVKDSDMRKRLSIQAVRWSKNFNWDLSYAKFRQLLFLN